MFGVYFIIINVGCEVILIVRLNGFMFGASFQNHVALTITGILSTLYTRLVVVLFRLSFLLTILQFLFTWYLVGRSVSSYKEQMKKENQRPPPCQNLHKLSRRLKRLSNE